VRLAGLGTTERAKIANRYEQLSTTTQWMTTEAELGNAMSGSGRLDVQEALSGPLMQLVSSRGGSSDEPELDPVAEPALAAILALAVEDMLSPEQVHILYEPFTDAIPLAELADRSSAD
jgi:hypothetical protein